MEESHCAALPLEIGAVVEGDDASARRLDPGHDLILHPHGAAEPVEVGDGKDVGLASLDHFHGRKETVRCSKRRPPLTFSSG